MSLERYRVLRMIDGLTAEVEVVEWVAGRQWVAVFGARPRPKRIAALARVYEYESQVADTFDALYMYMYMCIRVRELGNLHLMQCICACVV